MPQAISLSKVFEGWEGYNTSLVNAVAPRTPEELAWSPGPGLRTAGEIAAHIALGRIDWFHRMNAPGMAELAQRAAPWSRGRLEDHTALTQNAAEIVRWLNDSWAMIAGVLNQWTVDDLWTAFPQPYRGITYAVSRQWVLFRILIHDTQHGGQLSIILGQQGISLPDLVDQGGHLTEPPVMEGP